MNRFHKVWLAALVVKTILGIWLPLSNDEAYYWVWGHHPQWSYFDHPPMVGWLFWIGTFFEPLGNAARLPGVWLGHGTLLIWRRILQPYLNEREQVTWLIFVLFSPFLGLGSLIITPDTPLLFFWSLSLLIFMRMMARPTTGSYIALGVSLGLGFCSKYLIVLFVPAAALWLVWSGRWREVRLSHVPFAIVSGLAFCFPVLYWNSLNEWASFAFQLDHGLASEKTDPTWPLAYVGGQLLILFPPVIWLALRRREPPQARILHFFSWLPLAFFLYTSFKAPVEANWPIMSHPALLALAFINGRKSRWLKATFGIWLLAGLVVLSQIAFRWLPIPANKLKTKELTQFDVIIPVLQRLGYKTANGVNEACLPRPESDLKGLPNLPIYLGSYQMAGSLSYKFRTQFYKLAGMNRRDAYDFMSQSYPTTESFLVAAEWHHPLPKGLTEKGYVVTNRWTLDKDYHLVEVKLRAQNPDR